MAYNEERAEAKPSPPIMDRLAALEQAAANLIEQVELLESKLARVNRMLIGDEPRER